MDRSSQSKEVKVPLLGADEGAYYDFFARHEKSVRL